MLTAQTITTFLLVLALLLSSSPVSAQGNSVSDNDVITDARAAYYNLSRHNFSGFNAMSEPNWTAILATTATPERLKVFRSQRFSMSVDASGSVTVDREFDEKPNSRLAPSVKQIHENVQRLLSGFFGTWAFFMVSSPFPVLQIRIGNLDKEYRLSYTVGSTEVTLRMTNDFLIAEGQLSDSRSKRTIKPVFQKTSEGFLLRGYYTVFEPIGQGNRTTLETTIDYNDVGGMKLPGKIHIKGKYGAELVAAELKFSQYVMTAPKD